LKAAVSRLLRSKAAETSREIKKEENRESKSRGKKVVLSNTEAEYLALSNEFLIEETY
jgi:hypothetical protein